jgi:CRISPR-associated protein Cas2
MIVMVLERVTRALRGELTHWLLEVKAGVFVGDVNAMVRDRLWEKCTGQRGGGSVFQAWTTNNEQGFMMRLEGENDRSIVDWEGVQLIQETADCLDAVQKRRMAEGR